MVVYCRIASKLKASNLHPRAYRHQAYITWNHEIYEGSMAVLRNIFIPCLWSLCRIMSTVGGHQDRVGGCRLHGSQRKADHADGRTRQRVLQEMLGDACCRHKVPKSSQICPFQVAKFFFGQWGWPFWLIWLVVSWPPSVQQGGNGSTALSVAGRTLSDDPAFSAMVARQHLRPTNSDPKRWPLQPEPPWSSCFAG